MRSQIRFGKCVRQALVCLFCVCVMLPQAFPASAEEAESHIYVGFCGTYQRIFVNGNLLYEAGELMRADGNRTQQDADCFLPRNMADGSYAFENRGTKHRFAASGEGMRIPATIYNVYNKDDAYRGLNDNAQHWIREYAAEDGVFYLKNLETKLYLGVSAEGAVIAVSEDKKAEITFAALPEESPLHLLSRLDCYAQLSEHQRQRMEQIYESVAGDVFDQNGAYGGMPGDKQKTPRGKIDGIYKNFADKRIDEAGCLNSLRFYLDTKNSHVASDNYAGCIISETLPGSEGYTAALDPPIAEAGEDTADTITTSLVVRDIEGNINQTMRVTLQNNLVSRVNANSLAKVMPQIPYLYRRIIKAANVIKSASDIYNFNGYEIGIAVPNRTSPGTMIGNIIHEIAHAQDLAYGRSGYWTRRSTEWTDAGHADIFSPSPYGHGAAEDWREDFAEFCHLYFAAYNCADMRRAMEILFPNRSRLFREMRGAIMDGFSLWEEQLGGGFSVSLDPCGGVANPTSMEAFCGGVYGGLPIPVRTGYQFDGWHTEDGEPITAETNVAKVSFQTLYARWTPVIYTKSTLKGMDAGVVCHVEIIGVTAPCLVIAAAYAQERLSFVEIRPYSANTEDFTVARDFDTIKIMLWSGLNDMVPLAKPEILQNGEPT